MALRDTDISNNEILTKYRDALLDHFPDQMQQIILFGSRATGEARSESDIDVLVVVNWEEEELGQGFYAAPFSDHRWRKIIGMAYDLSLEYGVVLSPNVISKKRFERWSPLGSQIEKTGIEIWRRN